ncbi:MAG: hypothetical protein ABI947_17115 [Chloroflexota bacterium]
MLYPRGCSFTPFAIRIAFTSNYSLETCQDRLLHAQVLPSLLKDFFGASRLKFSFSLINMDLCEFNAEKKTGRKIVIAKGYLQKLEDGTTTVVGYADMPIYLYILIPPMALIMEIFLAVMVYDNTINGLYNAAKIMVLFLFIISVDILCVRHQARKLAHIIEETLNSVS